MSTSSISNDFLERWLSEPESDDHQPAERPKNIRKLKYPVEITAERDKHTGPSWDYARATMHFEPADVFITEILPQPDITYQEYLDSLIFGVIDALIHEETHAQLFGLKIIVRHAKEHPVDSKPWAFRVVGWMIGKELLKREHELSPAGTSTFEVIDNVNKW